MPSVTATADIQHRPQSKGAGGSNRAASGGRTASGRAADEPQGRPPQPLTPPGPMPGGDTSTGVAPGLRFYYYPRNAHLIARDFIATWPDSLKLSMLKNRAGPSLKTHSLGPPMHVATLSPVCLEGPGGSHRARHPLHLLLWDARGKGPLPSLLDTRALSEAGRVVRV